MDMKSMRVVAFAAAGLVIGWTVSSARAVVVTVTSGTDNGLVVFDSGGFENDTAGLVPSATAPASTSWSGTAISNTTTTVLTGSTSGGPNTAYSGDNYINNDRSVGSAILRGGFSRNINAQTESFKAEFAMWMAPTTDDSTSPPQAYFYLRTPGGTASPTYANTLAGFGMRYTADTDQGGTPELMKYRISGSSPNYGASTTSIAAPPSWTPGAWNTVLFEWDHATGTATLTVNNQTPLDVTYAFSNGTLPSGYAVPTTVGEIQLRANNVDTLFYVDSIPEPSSLGLAGIGCLLMCARRWK